LSLLQTFVPHWPQGLPIPAESVPHPPHALTGALSHMTCDLSALHAYFAHVPQELPGAAESVPQPPHALTPVPLHMVVVLSCEQT
jgi:hypothetical protein